VVPLRINVAQLGMVVVATALALLATAYHVVSVLAIVRVPECVALHPAALGGHRLVLALTSGAVVSLWMAAGWLLFATRRPPIQVVLALLAVAAVIGVSAPVGDTVADRWSGGRTEHEACW
jgi:hypothetical protein